MLFNSASFFFFYPLRSIIFFFYMWTLCSCKPQPPTFCLRALAPCLSCSRFSFCWRVLIGLKMGYLPNHTELQTIPKCKCLMGVGGGGGIVVMPPPPPHPPAALLIGGETPGLMGWQRLGPEENPQDYVSTHYNVHKDRGISRSTNGAVKSNRVGQGILCFHPDID